MNDQGSGRSRDYWIDKPHFWAALVSALCLHWLAIDLHTFFHEPSCQHFATALLFAAVAGLAAQWLYSQRACFRARTRGVRKELDAERRPHLVLFLSDLEVPDDDPGMREAGVPKFFREYRTDDLDRDLQKLRETKTSTQRWRWEMPLCALRHHFFELQGVVIICSDKSIRQAHWFVKIAQSYTMLRSVPIRILARTQGNPKLIPCTGQPISGDGCNFVDLEDLWDGTRFVLDSLACEGTPDKQIMIDFTGGTAVVSVAAVAPTFNRAIKAQYVDTNDTRVVSSFDLVMDGPPSHG